MMGGWQPTWTTLIRVSGLFAWYMLILEVMVGVIATGGMARAFVKVTDKHRLHRVISWVLVGAVAIHISTIVLSKYDPKGTVWTIGYLTEVGWGTVARNCAVVALYLLIAVMLVCVGKRWVPKKLWTRFHHSVPFIILVLATIHGLGAGTDSYTYPVMLPAVVALTILGMIFTVRRYNTFARRKNRRKMIMPSVFPAIEPVVESNPLKEALSKYYKRKE